MVLGEAAAVVAKEFAPFAAKHQEIDWTGMKSIRNDLAHGYFQIDYDAVWVTATNRLPDLLARWPEIQRDAIALQRGRGTGL